MLLAPLATTLLWFRYLLPLACGYVTLPKLISLDGLYYPKLGLALIKSLAEIGLLVGLLGKVSTILWCELPNLACSY